MAGTMPAGFIFDFNTRPSGPQTRPGPAYINFLPALAAPQSGNPESIASLCRRWYNSKKDWECLAHSGREIPGQQYQKLQGTLKGGLPAGFNTSSKLIPEPAWIAADPSGRARFVAPAGPTITAAALFAVLVLPVAATGQPLLSPMIPLPLGRPRAREVPALAAPAPLVSTPLVVPAAPVPAGPAGPVLPPAAPVFPVVPAPLSAMDEDEDEDDANGDWTRMLLLRGDIQPRNRRAL